MVARARKPTEKFKTYRIRLKREAKELKQRLKGTMRYVSVKYFERPEKNEDGSMKLDAFGMQIKSLMKSVSGPYVSGGGRRRV